MAPENIFSSQQWDEFHLLLDNADQYLELDYPGPRQLIQPVHTVYIPADAITSSTECENHDDIVHSWKNQAQQFFTEHTDILATCTPQIPEYASPVRHYDTRLNWLEKKLTTAPIMDLRIDFEDGYGQRSSIIEDNHAANAGRYIVNMLNDPRSQGAPLYAGIRTKGLTGKERRRMMDTLHIVLTHFGNNPDLIPYFIFTVPKIRSLDQVRALVILCEAYEKKWGLPEKSLHFELQIESPQAIVNSTGSIFISQALQISQGRCVGLPYGTYDYSAALGIVAPYQALNHPTADFAKNIMQIAAANQPVWLSDGSTQIFPIGSTDHIRYSTQRHYQLVYRALGLGIFQGWDMHPGHIVTRWLANYDFFMHAVHISVPRLNTYIARFSSDIIDEPATACALASVIIRALDLTIISEAELYDQSMIPILSEFDVEPRTLLEAIINRSSVDHYRKFSLEERIMANNTRNFAPHIPRKTPKHIGGVSEHILHDPELDP